MKDFLIISTICLFAFLAVYHLFLEKEKMHRFNRFYLLFSVVFSFVIPFISVPNPGETVIIGLLGKTLNPVVVTSGPKTDFYQIAQILYPIITAILLLRFAINLQKIRKSISSNRTQKLQFATLVLTQEKILPHTFLNYIFINADDYNSRNIETEIYTHELAHARQKHTLDVLFIELMKSIFWFNPIFIAYKNAIQLNHEFLADEKVVKSHNNVPLYQNLVISKIDVNQTYYLASNLNYSVTKKRLIMMTKNTSQARAALKQLALLPLFGFVALVSCSQSETALADSQSKIARETTEVVPVGKEENLKEPSFPGGLPEFYRFVAENFKMPSDYKGNMKLMATFIIEKDGSVNNVSVLKDLGLGTKAEAIRVIKMSPKWNPATVNNEPVRYQYVVPISLVSN